ncbi:MAG: class I SAM-dependent methyltransferase [Acidobacteria bacterium]|nr:class I SAM-dependent methyltransferase [Acidobacteriota bacterium]
MPRTEAFDTYSDAYDEWFDRHAAEYHAELAVIRRLLPSPHAKGLEVGVGSGKFAAPLGIGIGIEPSTEMARRASRRGVAVCRGIAEELPIMSGQVDFVLLVTTICFVDDVGCTFREAFRVLKTGGCSLVGFVDKESDLGRQYAANRTSSRFYQHATFFSTPEVLRYLEDAGFSVTDILQTLNPRERPATIRDGYGEGAFVVIKAVK